MAVAEEVFVSQLPANFGRDLRKLARILNSYGPARFVRYLAQPPLAETFVDRVEEKSLEEADRIDLLVAFRNFLTSRSE